MYWTAEDGLEQMSWVKRQFDFISNDSKGRPFYPAPIPSNYEEAVSCGKAENAALAL